MDRGNNDLFAVLDRFTQLAGSFCPDDGTGNLHKLFDGVLDLFVEVDPVGYHDNGVNNVLAILIESDQLVRQPRNGV